MPSTTLHRPSVPQVLVDAIENRIVANCYNKMMNKSTLYIMCGLPYSGKTTIGKKIADHVNAQMIAFDWIWAKEKPTLIPDIDKVEEWRAVLKVAHERIKVALESNESVVYDDVNQTCDQREVLRQIANDGNSAFVIVYLNTPLGTIRDREAKNRLSKERHQVASVNFEKALKYWETPVDEKDVAEFKPEMDVDEWIRDKLPPGA